MVQKLMKICFTVRKLSSIGVHVHVVIVIIVIIVVIIIIVVVVVGVEVGHKIDQGVGGDQHEAHIADGGEGTSIFH